MTGRSMIERYRYTVEAWTILVVFAVFIGAVFYYSMRASDDLLKAHGLDRVEHHDR